MGEGSGVVLLTDRAWPDDSVERRILGEAGFDLVAGPAEPAPAERIEQLVVECDPAAIMTCWAPVSATAIARAGNLRLVARMGVGLDNIAVETATARRVPVTNVPDYCVDEVSDHTVALVLNWTRGISSLDREVRSGAWNPAGARLRRLSTKTVGIVGYGRIGRATARKIAGFGCRILVCDPQVTVAAEGEVVELPTLLASSDVVILHAPLTPATSHLIGRQEFAAMRRGALLVNASRGGLVDTAALIAALEAGHLGGAALDVLEAEPDVDARLMAHPGVVITPHVAFSSDESLIELRAKAAEEVVRVLSGRAPRYLCNGVETSRS